VLGIKELDKPERTPCAHCQAGAGCGIYASRPAVCREFYCGYLVLPFVDPRWFPEECGMMIFPASEEKRLAVHVDPARPDAWKAAPFHADLRRWAAAAEQMDFQVFVAIGRRVIAILPHEDVDLGEFDDDDRLVYERHFVEGGSVLSARKVKGAAAPPQTG
jgi:hypothetical protein